MQAHLTSGETIFAWIEQLLQDGGAAAAFEQLAERFRSRKQYRELFDARLMQTRLELGLPLVSKPRIGDLPKQHQEAYQQASIRAAREIGELLLADGDIPQAWPYFRAIGDLDPIIQALDTYKVPDPETPESQQALSSTIQLAFHEGLHPQKGFSLILQHYGLCRAITMFGGYPKDDGRHESLRLLVRTLHDQLVGNLRRAIAEVEGALPERQSVASLIQGRDWLFENNAQHTDSSHIAPVLAFSADSDDRETLTLALHIAEYASRLGPMLQYSDEPPFDRVYEDRCVYLKALLGEDVDAAVRYFDGKAASSNPVRDGSRPAEVLVQLLIRVGRYGDAINAFRRYLMDIPAEHLSCPSLLQLCQMAGDFEQLKQVAKQQADPLSYIAALVQE